MITSSLAQMPHADYGPPAQSIAPPERDAELQDALAELRFARNEVERLSRELDDTNRGVLALYAELDDKAQDLARASELKTRFLSNMSHEFRTPLKAILGLSWLLLQRADGELTAAQEHQ